MNIYAHNSIYFFRSEDAWNSLADNTSESDVNSDDKKHCHSLDASYLHYILPSCFASQELRKT